MKTEKTALSKVRGAEGKSLIKGAINQSKNTYTGLREINRNSQKNELTQYETLKRK